MKNCKITVKEREAGEPCFLVVELYDSIPGLPSDKDIIFDMPDNTNIEQAREIARQLNGMDVRISVR